MEVEAIGGAIAERLSRAAAEDRFSGAVLVRAGDEVLIAAGFGEADREAKLPATAATRFRFASLGKMFTATAAVRLMQEGRLAPETRVGELLPDYPDPETAVAVTVHQLLTHTSGLGDVWGPEFDRHRLRLRACGDYVALFGARPPTSAPGAEYRYSTYGYILLGRLMEAASGRDYYDLVEALVFAPAGMADTGALPEEIAAAGLAVGYMRTPEGWRPNTDTLPYRGTPGGGGYSTIGDLDRFAAALEEGPALLDETHARLLTTPKVDAGEGARYGYGLMVETDHGTRAIGHAGAARGMAAVFRLYPEMGRRIIVLSNRDAPAAAMVARSIADALFAAA